MKTVLVVDSVGDVRGAIEGAAGAAGWAVARGVGRDVDAVVLATDAAGMGQALQGAASARQAGAAVVLVASIDRADWGRTFESAEMLGVDAMFGRPVDAGAVFRRLNGIVAARASAQKPASFDMTVILDRAIANEESAAAFYRRAADRVSDAVTRDALTELMRDEFEHKVLIEEFRSGTRALPVGTTSGGSLAESLGTPDFTPDMSPTDAFLLAARKEKSAVEFYENWAGLYPESPERELLLRLAEVERRHKAKVEAMFTNAAFPEAW